MLTAFWQHLLHFLLPAFCLFCQRPLPPGPAVLCHSCWDTLPWLPALICARCGAPFQGVVAPGALCQECLLQPPPFTRARAVVFYDGPVREAVHRFKYGRSFVHGRLLRQLLQQAPEIQAIAREAELLVPVPLHPRRLRQRGFNQALYLARAFPAVPLARQTLIRPRDTRPQTELSPAERRRNVRGAFQVTRPEVVAGKKVVVLDDVYTTGATVRECAKTLLRAGAARVEVITVARVGYAGG